MSVRERVGDGKWKLGLKLLAPMCISVGILVAVRLLGPELLDQRTLSTYLRPLGHWAPLAFVLLLGVRPVAFLPGQLFAAVGGILFGTLLGTVYSLLGSLLSTALIHLLASRFGQGPMKRLAGQRHEGLQRAARQHGFQVGFLACINSVIPGDVMLAVASASGARYLPLALGAAVGSIPGTLLTTFFGSSLSQGKTWTTVASIVGLVLSLGLGIFLGRRLAREMKIEPVSCPPPEKAEKPAAHPLLGKMQQGSPSVG
ncbi:TVP38/TMEM64 family protein [Archangium primigenium]|uniref:TVP38/TMEM64 family protein n=1 Tax=[Archangium] primigenium TaxID=2792470 RepID=UPI00195AB631|nr:TVP38/TMEM64 family protein [Archangium primigenium]MBM7119463.1 TVP38/TMEM64 family protein [Archangium primigenium]